MGDIIKQEQYFKFTLIFKKHFKILVKLGVYVSVEIYMKFIECQPKQNTSAFSDKLMIQK